MSNNITMRDDPLVCSECVKLRAGLAAARADAARYRWIRDRHEVRGRAMEIVYGMNGSDWDAAIDAALAGEKNNGP